MFSFPEYSSVIIDLNMPSGDVAVIFIAWDSIGSTGPVGPPPPPPPATISSFLTGSSVTPLPRVTLSIVISALYSMPLALATKSSIILL